VARAPWHPGRCAQLALADGTVVGHAGELHPKVTAALELPSRTVAGELDVDALIAATGTPLQANALSTYPLAHTDVALVVGEFVPAAAVEAALREGAGESLESLVLFDVYRGEQVGAGHKSLACRLTFRAMDRTLTTDEVSALRDKAVAAAAAHTGATQR
jgi:phenylalanyl-tRNA synthetase beta chain